MARQERSRRETGQQDPAELAATAEGNLGDTKFVTHGAIPPVSADETSAPSPTASDRGFGTGFDGMVEMAERYDQLHSIAYRADPIVPRELPPVSPVPADQQTVFSQQEQQELRESLAGGAVRHPFAGELSAMGMTDAEMPVGTRAIENYDEIDRTTMVPGYTQQQLPGLEYQTAATQATMRGDTLPPAPAGNTEIAGQREALDGATKNEPYSNEKLSTMLEMLALRLSMFMTESSSTMLDHAQPVKQAVVTLIEGRTQWLRDWRTSLGTGGDLAGHARIRLLDYVAFASNAREFAMLRELSVMDPALARSLGSAYIAELRNATAAINATPLAQQV